MKVIHFLLGLVLYVAIAAGGLALMVTVNSPTRAVSVMAAKH